MAINWTGVKALLDQAATESRTKPTIDEAMDTYNQKVVEALQLMISTAVVSGGTCTDGGPVAGAAVS